MRTFLNQREMRSLLVFNVVVLTCILPLVLPANAQGFIDMPTPQTWGACPLDNSKDTGKVIRTWRRVGPFGNPVNYLNIGTIELKCGTRDVGFRHISARHAHDWQRQAWLENRNWREIADMAITKNLTDPDQQEYSGNGKWCTSSEIYFVEKVNGRILKVLRTVTIVTDKREVLTVFPGPKGCDF